MKFRYLFIIIPLLIIGNLEAQSNLNLTGKVMDAFTKEPIPFATIKWALSKKGTIADSIGNFKITKSSILKDTLLVTYVGYDQSAIVPTLIKKDALIVTLNYTTS